jgi:hypothetical protein
MPKYELKTKATKSSVEKFLDSIEDERKRDDAYAILDMMQKASKEEPKMWGPSIIGFGTYHYKYDSGHEGDMCRIGFSPRKAALTLYILMGFEGYDELMAKLGKYKTSKACLYIKKLEDIDVKVLKKLITLSVKYTKAKYK